MRRRWRVVAASLALVVVALLVRLAVAPLHLPLSGLAVDALTKALGTPVHVGGVGVQLTGGGLSIALDDVRLRGEAVSASIGRISVVQGLDGRSVALHGAALRLDPSQGEPQALVVPHPDAAIAALDQALKGALAEGRKAGVRLVEVQEGRLDVVSAGRPIDEARVFQSLEARIDLADPEALSARANAIGASGPIGASLARTVEPDGAVALQLSAHGVSPSDFVNAGPLRSGFAIAPQFLARLAPDGTVAQASLDIAVGPGTVLFGRDPPRDMDAASFRLTRSPDGLTLMLDEGGIVAGPTRVFMTGTIVPAQDEQTPWLFDLRATEGHMDAPDIDGPPVIVDAATASGNIDFANRLLTVDLFHVAAPNAQFDTSFSFDFSEHGPNLTGAAEIGPSAIDTLMGLWPPVMAHQPRIAVLNTVHGGVVRSGQLQFAMTPLELDGDPSTNDMIEGGLSIDIEFAGATLTTPEVPISVQRARGQMRMRDKTLSARIDHGVVPAGEGGALTVRSGAFTIPTLAELPPQALLKATVDGPLSAVVAMANRLDLPELKKTPLGPDDVEGEISADLRLRTPLADHVPDSARIWEVNARLINAASKVPIAGQTFSDANIEVAMNTRRLAARGRARIDGLQVDVNYSEIFNGEKSGAARFVMTDKDRKDRGFDTGDMVAGPVVITLEALDDETRLFSADLTEAAVTLPVLAKAAGEALTATGQVVGEPPDLSVTGLTVAGPPGLDIAGDIAMAKGGLAHAKFPKFALSAGDDAQVELTHEEGVYKAVIKAKRFDGRTIVKQITKPPAGKKKPPAEPEEASAALDLDLTADTVRINDDNRIADLSVKAQYDGRQMARLSVHGKLNGVNAGTFAAELKPGENGTRRLQADIATLGRALKALGVYGRMRGGRTTVDARLDDDGVVAGRLTASDFVLADEKTLEDILRRAKYQNTLKPIDKAAPQPAASAVDGLVFDRLVVDFTKRDETIEISEAILKGPILGGTASGTIDLESRTVALNGTIIPAYGLNNLFGRVPLFGEILGGGNKGGLIGVTFRLAGPLDNPQVLVNPMSAIAPGIFRRIFEFR